MMAPVLEARKVRGGRHNLFNGLGQFLRAAVPQARLPHAYEHTSNLRLESGHRNDQDADQKSIVQVGHVAQGKALDHLVGNDGAGHKNENHPSEEPLPTGSLQKIDDPVHHQADQQKLNNDRPPLVIHHNPVQVVKQCVHGPNPFEKKGRNPLFYAT
jgi:hypothetical protein